MYAMLEEFSPATAMAIQLRSWRDTLLAAQLDLGEQLSRAIAADDLNLTRYVRWLCLERAITRITSRLLQPISDGCQPPQAFAHWLLATCVALRDAEAAVTADLAFLGVDGTAEPPGLAGHCGGWAELPVAHTYRAVGAAALLDATMGGPARDAVVAVLELSCIAPQCSRYLAHRHRQLSLHTPWRQRELERLALDESERADLAIGASGAANDYRELCANVLGSPSHPIRIGGGLNRG